jgi:hypothetical protein
MRRQVHTGNDLSPIGQRLIDSTVSILVTG